MTEPQTVLAANIATVGATTCTVGDVLGFPSSGTFTVLIGSERILVGAGAGTTSWSSLTRGHQQTTAATHLAGAAVTLVPDLITTAADADANSYLSVGEADALAGDDLGPEAAAWLAATTANKEAALKRATREVNGHLTSAWDPFDRAAQRISNLRFPRSIDTDADGEPIIPREIELATYQQAIFVLKNAAVIANAAARRAQGVDTASEPNLSWSQGEDDSTLCGMARHYLSGFAVASAARGSPGGLRSVRVASGFLGGL